ncbi:MAG: DNA-nicking Smr family endonuclease [Gammaproteobacteria bacterium]|jgi:DNA-nicking Smr family endonuclease
MNDKLIIDPEDIALFRKTVGDVISIKQNKAKLIKAVTPLRQASRKYKDENIKSATYYEEFIPENFRISATEQLQFKRPGIQDKLFQKLKRGQLSILDNLDLHGMTIFNAKLTFNQFMLQTRKFNTQTCVRVIHGKGYRSKDGQPKIKQNIQLWLQEDKNVLAYSSCRPADGGTGAIYLLIKGGKN